MSKNKKRKNKEPQLLSNILRQMAHNDIINTQTIYINVYEGVYDGDNEGGVKLKVNTDKMRAKSKYLADAYDLERYFLNTFGEHAIINRDDNAMFCECYSETKDYCYYHAIVYVKSYDL